MEALVALSIYLVGTVIGGVLMFGFIEFLIFLDE